MHQTIIEEDYDINTKIRDLKNKNSPFFAIIHEFSKCTLLAQNIKHESREILEILLLEKLF